MNKKTYIKPTIEVAVLAPEAMLSSSNLSINSEQTVDTSQEGTQLGQGHRGSWGDLWE